MASPIVCHLMAIRNYGSIVMTSLFLVFFNFGESFKSAKLLREDLAESQFVQLSVYALL